MNFVQLETHKSSTNEDNLIPLINVVFLMLIFFMVAGVIRATEGTDIKHPASVTTKALAKETLTLIVNKDGNIVLDDQIFSYEHLTPTLLNVVAAKETVADLYLILRVDGSLSAQTLHKVLKSIRDAGLLKVQLLTELGVAI